MPRRRDDFHRTCMVGPDRDKFGKVICLCGRSSLLVWAITTAAKVVTCQDCLEKIEKEQDK